MDDLIQSFVYSDFKPTAKTRGPMVPKRVFSLFCKWNIYFITYFYELFFLFLLKFSNVISQQKEEPQILFYVEFTALYNFSSMHVIRTRILVYYNPCKYRKSADKTQVYCIVCIFPHVTQKCVVLTFEYSKVSLEAVNKPFYGFSQYMYMCNSVEVVKKNVGQANV